MVLETARRLQAGQPVARTSIGVVVRETDGNATGLGGLEVTRFQPGSSARRAGLRAGDVIVEVDGVATPRVVDLQRAVWRHRAGESIPVVFLRGGQRLRLAVRVE